ncbi:MAG: hypothetical protein WBG86_19125 [Polyangiales bacterium]
MSQVRTATSATLTISLLLLGCGGSTDTPIGNTEVVFEAPITYRPDEFRWDYGCPDIGCPATGFCDQVRIDPVLYYVEEQPPVAAGTMVEGFLDLPPAPDCSLEATIETDDALCVGTGTRPAGAEYTLVTLEFECVEEVDP